MIEAQAQLTRGEFRLEADFAIAGGVSVLFGRSGSGKTTAADLVAGLLRPTRGRVVLNGEVMSDTTARLHVPPWRRRVGYVFQDTRLFPHLNVHDNLLYGACRRGLSTSRLPEVVGLLGLDDLLARYPNALSGGEARRAAIGRALISDPALLILDEPMSGLDGARRAEILPHLDALARSGPPILYVTHSVDEAARLADEVLLAVEGRVFNAGPPEQAFARPEAVDAASLGAPVSVLEGRAQASRDGAVTTVDLGGTLFRTPPLDVTVGDRVRIVVDARDVALALSEPANVSFQNRLTARITAVETGKDGALIRLEGAGFRLSSLVTGHASETLGLVPGREIIALVKATASARYA